MTNFLKKVNEFSLRMYFKFGPKLLIPVVLLGASEASAQAWNTPIVPWNPTNISDFGALVNQIINFITAFVGVVAVIYLIWAGFNYIMAQGNAKKVGAAKEAITNAVMGIIIVVIAYLIVQLVLVNLLNIKQSSSWS